MRVLVTGMSGHQAGKQPKIKYVTVASMIADAIRDAGHEVTHRQAEWNEDLSQSDVVVIGMVPPYSIAAHAIYPALKLIRDAVQANHPVLLYVDDPNFYQFKNQYPSVERGIHRIFRENMYGGRPHYQDALAVQDEFQEIITWLTHQDWPPMLYPAYDFGDREKMPPIRTVKKIYADPSGYAPEYPFSWPAQRERSWVIGGIVDPRPWLEKLGGSWPVEMYGNAKYNLRPLLEEQLVARFAETRGVLCQPRKVTYATGWWRSRYYFAAKTRSILVGDLGDLAPLGAPYQLTVQDVEAMDESQLDAAAAAQAGVMLDLAWDRVRYSWALNEALSAAIDLRGATSW